MSNMSNKGSIASEDLLPIAIKSIVASAERMEHMNVNTDAIVARLSNGIGADIKNITTILKTEVIPKLDIEKALIKCKEAEIKAKIEEIKAEEKMYNIKFRFYGTLATLILGSGSILFAIIKWIVIPFLGLPSVQ